MWRTVHGFVVLAGAFAAGLAGCSFKPQMMAEPGTGGSSVVLDGGGLVTGSGGRVVITGEAGSGVSTGGAGGSTGMSTLDANCGAKSKQAAKLPPDILIVLDASGSMDQNIMNMTCQGGCGATSKWAQLIPALNQVVMQTQADVNWGLKFFASNNDCAVNATAEVPVAANNAAAIAAVLTGRTAASGGVANGSRTPTRAGVDQGAAYLMGVADMNPKYIVLATDGVANCPMSGGTNNDDTAGAVAAAGRAFAANIPVFVVGMATAGVVTNGVDANMALSMMANAGGRPRAGDPTYYSVTSAAELASTLITLVGMANTCTFQIGPLPTTDGTTGFGNIDVFGDGTMLPRDTTHTNGWDYVDASMSSIRIYGSTCDAVMAGTIMSVSVSFQCLIP